MGKLGTGKSGHETQCLPPIQRHETSRKWGCSGLGKALVTTWLLTSPSVHYPLPPLGSLSAVCWKAPQLSLSEPHTPSPGMCCPSLGALLGKAHPLFTLYSGVQSSCHPLPHSSVPTPVLAPHFLPEPITALHCPCHPRDSFPTCSQTPSCTPC